MPNFDVATGIHYGCISQHSLDQDAIQCIFDDGENLTYEAAKRELKNNLRSAVSDMFYTSDREGLKAMVEDLFDCVEDKFNDNYQAEDEQYCYESSGYRLSNSPSLVCIFVEKSEYYTYARQCSPCVPNAGDLDNWLPKETEGGPSPYARPHKTYCLGSEWFEGDKAPYPVYRVADDTEVAA